jgi:anti-sigma regulatory factor (Ser/Thr protein kinase)
MNYREIVLAGRYSQYTALHDFIASFADFQGYSASFLDALQLSLKEAFVNAVKHGNRERDELNVTCSLRAEGTTLLASMRDCGSGFDPDELPDPADRRHRLRLSGRGVYIIRSIAEITAIERDKDGTTLKLRYISY